MSRLRHVQTAFVQDQFQVRTSFETEPYEAGWASEAIAFVYVRAAPAAPVPAPDANTGFAVRPALWVRAQISADGRRWIDDERLPGISQAGNYRLRLTHFGNWLRLVGETEGLSGDEHFVIDTYWVFKE
ncbi:MAG: hypothetical protein HY332_15390 [Chloroflexi bacterium]|nr:hypothetical protein [Chloroflexota bacterium]